jgi:hypothetical protein
MRVPGLLALAGLGFALAATPAPLPSFSPGPLGTLAPRPSPSPTLFRVIITTKSHYVPPQKFLPTPPPDVLARTKYVYEANLANVRPWLPFMAAAPEERYVKMYVTSVKRVMGVQFCRGWVVRVPIKGTEGAIVDEDVTFVCSRKMHPYVHGATPEAQETVPPE